MKEKLKDLFTKKEVISAIAAFIVIFAFLYYVFFTPNYYEGKSPKRFEIHRGEGLSAIVENLYDEGIVPNRFNMKVAAFLYGGERRLKAGRYYIPNDLSYVELVEFLIYGDADYLRKLNVHKGSTLEWLGSKVQYKLFVDSSAFVELCRNEDFVDSLGINAKTMEGYLLPQDYWIYENCTPREVVNTIYKGFNKFINSDTVKNKLNEIGYSLHEVLTLASIVEGETKKEDEMPRIAGVYLNRLKAGMKLQADPTIQYALPGPWRRLLYRDLNLESPYNTYKYIGLPPGPINNPGKAAILSVLYPEEHNYYYFVVNKEGGHKFSRNYREHINNVREYRRWIRSQRQKLKKK